MTTWSFMRHGQSEANLGGWFAGSVDSPLTAAGMAQAVAARAHVAQARFARAFSSDLVRAHRTAQLALEGRNVVLRTAAALRERTCGAWEGRPIAEIEAAGQLHQFSSWTARPGGGESLRDTAARALRFLADIDDGTDTLIVAHGALMRATIGAADAMPHDEIGRWRPTNCELVTRDYAVGHFAAVLERIA